MCVCASVCVCGHARLHLLLHRCMSLLDRVYTYVCVYVHVCARSFVCVCARACVCERKRERV